MGTSMASASFRRPQQSNWLELKPKIQAMYQGIERLVNDLEKEQSAHAVISPYGDMGMFLQDIPQRVSALTGDYAIFCMCVDSDFALLELYHNGQLVEKSVLGEPELLAEIDELSELGTPELAVWKPLLLNIGNLAELLQAFTEDAVFIEDQLRKISELTGIPIFDDEMVYESF